MPERYPYIMELFPVITLVGLHPVMDQGSPAEFSDEELADIARVDREWREWQQKMAERFNIELD